MMFDCSDRGLGFPGYSDDHNEAFAAPGVATSAKSAELRTSHKITSDINRNPLKIPQTTNVDNSDDVKHRNGTRNPSSSVRAETKARERLDDNKHDTHSQVQLITCGKHSSLVICFSLALIQHEIAKLCNITLQIRTASTRGETKNELDFPHYIN